jgi:hypothetical protein
MDNIYIYIGILLLIIVAVIVVRKVASCLLKSIIGLIVLAVAAYLYYRFKFLP